mgnify:CR=1 FL=1
MNKETAKRRILELTFPDNWDDNDEVVAEVQRLEKIWSEQKPMRGRKQKKIVVWHNNQILVTGTARELEKTLGMKEQTIRNWIWKKRPDSKGRLFKYLEEK